MRSSTDNEAGYALLTHASSVRLQNGFIPLVVGGNVERTTLF